jgi:DNA topoisomerase-1
MSILITESPIKAKKIKSFLGSEYQVISSCGHIRDLQAKKLSIDVENKFKPSYRILQDKQKIVKEMKEKSQGKQVFLAADDDREGEAIAWHCSVVLKLKVTDLNRITYREVTEQAVKQSLQNKRCLNMNEVYSQQARRIIDRLIGFKLSPCLWKHITTNEQGLSAGRVQSALLELLYRRETYIENFERKCTMKLKGVFPPLTDSVFEFKEKPIFSEEYSNTMFTLLKQNRLFQIHNLRHGEEQIKPKPPLITSTLQQYSHTELGFSVSQTMNLAQRLFEGGHITYMRTDSTYIAKEFQQHLQKEIQSVYGNDIYQPPKHSKVKGAQEAHEAIRPTKLMVEPSLEGDEKKLYDFIRKYTVMSHMIPAKYEVRRFELTNSETKSRGKFTNKEKRLDIPGYLLYENKTPEDPFQPLKTEYTLKEAVVQETQQSEPNYYNDADIVKLLENTGIGRPSTYASIVSTVYNRKYTSIGSVEKKKRKETTYTLYEDDSIKYQETEIPGKIIQKRFRITSLGKQVLSYLQQHFSHIIHKDFTVSVEQDLDKISQGEIQWIDVVRKVYTSFSTIVDKQMGLSNQSSAKHMGEHKQHEIYLAKGKYGPYLKIIDPQKKTINKGIEGYLQLKHLDIETLTLDDCLDFLSYPKKMKEGITIHIGPYGYYMKQNGRNYKIHQRGSYTQSYCDSIIQKQKLK